MSYLESLDIGLLCKLAKETLLDTSLYYNEHLLDLDYLEDIGEEKFELEFAIRIFFNNFIGFILREEADKISQQEEFLFEPIDTIKSILKSKYNLTNIDIVSSYNDIEDYTEVFDDFIYELDTKFDNIYHKMVTDTCEEMYKILSKDLEFLELINYFYDEYLFS